METVGLYGGQGEAVFTVRIPLANGVVKQGVVNGMNPQRQDADGIATPNAPEAITDNGIPVNDRKMETVIVIRAAVTNFVRKVKRCGGMDGQKQTINTVATVNTLQSIVVNAGLV